MEQRLGSNKVLSSLSSNSKFSQENFLSVFIPSREDINYSSLFTSIDLLYNFSHKNWFQVEKLVLHQDDIPAFEESETL